MVNVNVLYSNRSAAKRFVDSCENSFKKEVLKVSNSIINSNSKIITLCGPTCSGKTTTASILTDDLEKNGMKAKVLSVDDFYFSSEDMMLRNITDYESIDAIDLECFQKVVFDLINCNPVKLPVFNFTTQSREYTEEYIPLNNNVFIIEGIQAMYPEITNILNKYNPKSIFISVSQNISICGIEFDKNEVRLMRRIVRDYFYRNSTADKTMSLWPNVRRNEEANIYSFESKSDYIIDSLLPYEIFVISKFFLDITEGYHASNIGYETIQALRNRLSHLLGSSITSDMVPENSVFQEFIL